ncbi:MAG TPA: glycine--tRNA ligase subunit beta [Syntrophaceae bacterium]|nr:glycine--tRNA ligase subunit beta [Syntrophaceae bacterium]
MAKELLLEIGTEEIPSAFIPPALVYMKDLLEERLRENRIAHGEIKSFGTPRRLVVLVSDVAEEQEERVTQITGPPKGVGFDEHGKPTRAAVGFAKGQGVKVSDLELIETEKGEYLCIRKREGGLDTRELLQKILPEFILSIPFPKSMRWSNSSIRFVRPIHWILALFGREVIPFKLGDLNSSNISFGHHFMKPGPFKVGNATSYFKKMQEAYVVVDPQKRKDMIEKGTMDAAKKMGGTILPDDELLELVTYSVEYPAIICGTFDERFLKLPEDVLIASMREHQRYFAVADKDGNLMPHFMAISNIPIKDTGIVTGHERVLAARLSDAQFFFEVDQKIPLEDRVEQLKGVIFHSELGTSYEKVRRIQALAVFLAEILFPDKRPIVERAARLCKADLTTEMVKEFPKLQGTMGKIYALLSGEPEEVAHAIYEHYLPLRAGGELPSSHVGAIIGLADKMDTICGCFGIGLIPSGTADPYALRRQALGIIHIIRDKGYVLSLSHIINKSISLLGDNLKEIDGETVSMVKEFFELRLYHQLISEDYPYDVIESVLSIYSDDILDSVERIKALNRLRLEGNLEPLVITFKRVANIAGKTEKRMVDPSLFEDPVESLLYEDYRGVAEYTERLFREKDYYSMLLEFLKLKDPVDRYFEGVLVMTSDKNIRDNRLALLGMIYHLFLQLADFSKIITQPSSASLPNTSSI